MRASPRPRSWDKPETLPIRWWSCTSRAGGQAARDTRPATAAPPTGNPRRRQLPTELTGPAHGLGSPSGEVIRPLAGSVETGQKVAG